MRFCLAIFLFSLAELPPRALALGSSLKEVGARLDGNVTILFPSEL